MVSQMYPSELQLNKVPLIRKTCFYASPQTLKKLKAHIALGLSVLPSVSPSVCASVTKIKLLFWNFINRFVIKKRLTRISLVQINYLPCGVMPLFNGHNTFLLSRYIKKFNS